MGSQADTVSDVRALSRKALLRVLEKFPEEEELPGGRVKTSIQLGDLLDPKMEVHSYHMFGPYFGAISPYIALT